MSTRATLIRHNLIINKLRRRSASFKEIDAYLTQQEELQKYKLRVDKRTFRRDIIDILSLYQISIEYDKKEGGYRIVTDNLSESNNRLFEAFDTFNAFNLTNDLSRYVHFEKRKPKGTENLYGLIHAIKTKVKIEFTYRDFWEEEPRNCIAEPHFLKEFKNRWYILAKHMADNKVRRFALDRLTDLSITKKQFNSRDEYNIEADYKDCFGIIPPNAAQPSEVILSFDAYQGKYIQSLKLHHSQETIINNEDELQIKLKLFITHDFIMELLSYGETVTVIKPESLKNEIKALLQNALNNYS